MNCQEKRFKPYRYYFEPTYQQQSDQQQQQQYDLNTTKRSRRKRQKQYRAIGQGVWTYLYNQGIKDIKQRQYLDKVQQYHIDTQCTFQPNINQTKKYLIPSKSTFLQRNQVWYDNKLQKIVKQKQENLMKSLKDYTFTPKLNKKSKLYINKQNQCKDHHKLNKNKNVLNPEIVKDIKLLNQKQQKIKNPNQRIEMNAVRLLLRKELKRIQI